MNLEILDLSYLPNIGESESNSSTRTKFLRGLGAKKNVSPSSNGMAELNSGSSSSSPK